MHEDSVGTVRRSVSGVGLLILGLGSNRLQTIQGVFVLVEDSMLVSLVVDIETYRVRTRDDINSQNKRKSNTPWTPSSLEERSIRYLPASSMDFLYTWSSNAFRGTTVRIAPVGGTVLCFPTSR